MKAPNLRYNLSLTVEKVYGCIPDIPMGRLVKRFGQVMKGDDYIGLNNVVQRATADCSSSHPRIVLHTPTVVEIRDMKQVTLPNNRRSVQAQLVELTVGGPHLIYAGSMEQILTAIECNGYQLAEAA